MTRKTHSSFNFSLKTFVSKNLNKFSLIVQHLKQKFFFVFKKYINITYKFHL